jgi:nitroreductase
MREESPSRELVEKVLDAAIWAPNHHLTEPWRFVVLAGGERRQLGDRLSSALEQQIQSEQQKDELLKSEREKPLSAPVIIAMIFSPKDGAKIIPQEELVAAGASLENALLAAHSLGLGTFVRTGSHAYSETIRRYLEMKDKESLLAFIYLGYPAEPARPTSRTPVAAKIAWRGL